MFKKFYKKFVKVYLKSGESVEGMFTDVFSEYDNDGEATIIIGKWEINENDVEKMEVINSTQ